MAGQDLVAWEIPGADGQPIYGDAHVPRGEAAGVLLICHGFKGYKDYGLFPRLAAAAERGLIAHRFNFSHSGMTRRIETFERPELFERETWMKQVHDVRAVAAAVRRGEIAGGALPMVWFGHSRGGVTVLLAANDAPDEPVGLVTAGAPNYTCNLSEHERRALRKHARLPSPSSRTQQTLYVGKQWLEEIEADPERHDPLKAIAQAPCPVLVVHGSGDATIDLSCAEALAAAGGEKATLRVIEGASHTFDARNPLGADAPLPPSTAAIIEATCDFAVGRCGG